MAKTKVAAALAATAPQGKPSAFLDTRVIYCGDMTNDDRQRGLFVSFDYSQEAHDEVAKFHKNTGRIIKLITVQEILDERHVQKM